MLQQDIFIKRYGVRTPSHLLAPIMPALEVFEFPRNSVYHYVAYESLRDGPPSDDYFLRNIDKKIFLQHVVDYPEGANKGTPRRAVASLNQYIRQFHLQNKRFRLSTDLNTSLGGNEMILGMVNYAMLSRAYRYNRSMYAEYFRWWNIQKTVWHTIATLTARKDPALPAPTRNHYVFAGLPKIFTSVQRLETQRDEVDQSYLRYFSTHEAMFVAEMWKWMTPERTNSSVIGTMDQSQLDKVNVVFQESGRWLVINLGMLRSWMFEAPIQDKPGIGNKDQKFKVKPLDIRKRFLRMLMTLMENRTVAEDELDKLYEPEKNDLENAPIDPNAPNSNILSGQNFDQELNDSKRLKAESILSRLDEDLKQLEVMEFDRDSKLEEEQKRVEAAPLSAATRRSENPEVSAADFFVSKQPDVHLKTITDNLADAGLLTVGEYRRFDTMIKAAKTAKSPDPSKTMEEFTTFTPEEMKITKPFKIPDNVLVLDKSMLETSLKTYDEHYVTKVMDRHIAAMAVSAQRAGFILNGYEVEHQSSILGDYKMYTLRAAPIQGKSSPLRFKLPVVKPNGEYMSGGTKYRMRKQRVDKPIRKISPDQVALTSYYGKSFVTRNQKKVNNYGQWLSESVMEKGFNTEEGMITELHPSVVFDNLFPCPRGFSSLAMTFRRFKVKGYEFILDHHEHETVFGKDLVKKYNRGDTVLLADGPQGPLILDKNNVVYALVDGSLVDKGPLEAFLGLKVEDTPVEFVEARVFGKDISVGLILAYKYGLSELMAMLKVTPRRVQAGGRLNLQDNEYPIVFADETLIFSKDDQLASLILAGLREFEKGTKNFSVYNFDKPDVYMNVLEANGLGARYLREIDQLDNMYVDPITEQTLKDMGEPTSYRALLVRGAEMLVSDQHKSPQDISEQMIRGYERMVGAVYSELVKSVREHSAKAGKANNAIEMHPYAVWKRVTQDPSIGLCVDINPIQVLKEQEAVTYNGVGGRSSRSMVRSTREYHPNDMGVISEATVDSSDVAINTYTSANPQIGNLLGHVKTGEDKKVTATSLLSTTALLSPGSMHDDGKRVNFASIQQSHSIASPCYHSQAVRTGYESVVPHRVGEGFCKMAEKDGRVVSISKNGMTVEYADKTTESFEIGTRYGRAAGITVPHELITDLEVGKKFTVGDPIFYHKDFFERDRLSNLLLWKNAVTVRVAMMETRQTHEDACSISLELADKLSTRTTKEKTVVATFGQTVSKVLKPGTHVEHDTILCIIEDAVTAGAKLFDDDSLNTLRILSSKTPTAKMKGTIERIEVFYNGDTEDMTDSLRELVNESDRELKRRCTEAGKPRFTGAIDEAFRVDGEPLGLDQVAIRFYITGDVPAGIGDKGVIANQLKTVISEVREYPVKTEKGEAIDILFGAQSVFNRIVTSPFLIGMSNPLLRIISSNAAKIYEGEMKP